MTKRIARYSKACGWYFYSKTVYNYAARLYNKTQNIFLYGCMRFMCGALTCAAFKKER